MNSLPDALFWYGLSVTLAGAIIVIVWKYIGSVNDTFKEINDTFKEVKKAVNELVVSNNVANVRLNGHDKELEEIKEGKYMVKYQGNRK